jgi:type IV pilus assembly protein PilV
MHPSTRRARTAYAVTHGHARWPARAQRVPGRRNEHGLTLIEILVTMVLLGVGLLGLAGLQLRGMQVNQGSSLRSQAAILAEDLADRLRADSLTAAAHGYDGNWTPGGTAPQAAVAPLLADWRYRMQTLPNGCAVIDTKNQAPAMVITVTWNDTRATRAADATASATAGAQCALGPTNGAYVLTTE